MDKCKNCGKKSQGGIITNGDPCGDGKKVGVKVGPTGFWCWECYDKDKSVVPDLNPEIDAAFAARGLCGFLEAYIGRCTNPKPCAKHSKERCWKCGKPATKQCSNASFLVCGMPECPDHPHFYTH